RHYARGVARSLHAVPAARQARRAAGPRRDASGGNASSRRRSKGGRHVRNRGGASARLQQSDCPRFTRHAPRLLRQNSTRDDRRVPALAATARAAGIAEARRLAWWILRRQISATTPRRAGVAADWRTDLL